MAANTQRRHCTHCGDDLPIRNFHVKRIKQDGTRQYKSVCAPCCRQVERDGRKVWRPVIEQAIREWLTQRR